MIKKFFRRMIIKRLTWETIEQNLTKLKFLCGEDISKWQEEAKKGNQVAINIVAELNYANHKESSLEMLQILADHEYAPAQLSLGLLYIAGKDLQQNLKKGFSLIKDSAIKGHAPSFYQLALCYKTGVGTKQNQAEYLKNMSIAQDLDYPHAYNDLGEFYFTDDNLQDLKTSYNLIKRASQLGIVSAYYRRSQFYLNGLAEVKQDVVQAFVWLTIALKDANSQEKEEQDKLQLENNLQAVTTLKNFLQEKDLAEVPPIIQAIEEQIKEERNKNKWLNIL